MLNAKALFHGIDKRMRIAKVRGLKLKSIQNGEQLKL